MVYNYFNRLDDMNNAHWTPKDQRGNRYYNLETAAQTAIKKNPEYAEILNEAVSRFKAADRGGRQMSMETYDHVARGLASKYGNEKTSAALNKLDRAMHPPGLFGTIGGYFANLDGEKRGFDIGGLRIDGVLGALIGGFMGMTLANNAGISPFGSVAGVASLLIGGLLGAYAISSVGEYAADYMKQKNTGSQKTPDKSAEPQKQPKREHSSALETAPSTEQVAHVGNEQSGQLAAPANLPPKTAFARGGNGAVVS